MYKGKLFCIVNIIILLLTSCIKRFDPEIVSSDAVKYVITGQVNRGDNVQVVNVSTTAPLFKPVAIPVTGCIVKILDSKGTSYPATDKLNGNYEVTIPQSEIRPGSIFKVDILVSGQIHIVSDFDSIVDGPDVDSVYYITQKLPTETVNVFTQGIQIYLDLNAEKFSCRHYRIEAFETWEYHTLYPIEWYYNGKINHKLPPDSSKMVCWRTSKLRDAYVLSTQNLSQNAYNKYALNFVDNASSARLVYGYSLLVRQYTLSERAYDYWEKIRSNGIDQGGLYESQPMVIKGNMHNLSNPDQQVLGFFGASTVKEKRIFVKNVPDLPNDFVFNCVIDNLPRGGLPDTNPLAWPIYLPAHSSGTGTGTIYSYDLLSIDHECVDCTSTVGGTTTKPDFWPY